MLSRVPLADDTSRHSRGDHAIGQRLRNDGARGDNRIAANVGEHDGVAADPGACADANQAAAPRLLANGH